MKSVRFLVDTYRRSWDAHLPQLAHESKQKNARLPITQFTHTHDAQHVFVWVAVGENLQLFILDTS